MYAVIVRRIYHFTVIFYNNVHSQMIESTFSSIWNNILEYILTDINAFEQF